MPFSAKLIRRLRRLLIVLACVATLIAVAWQIENIRGEREWKATLKTYADRGEPLDTLPVPLPIPAEENFLQTPLLTPLLLEKYDSSKLTAFRSKEPFFDFAPTTQTLWDNGEHLNLGLLARDIAKQRAEKKLPALSPSKDADLILAQFNIEKPDLAELREAALFRPLARVVRPGPPPAIGQLLKIEFPNFSIQRYFARQLMFQSSALLANSQPDLAYPSVLAAIQLAKGLGDHPYTLVETMISAVLIRMAIQPVWEGVRQHSFTDSQLARFSASFSEMDLLGALAQTIRNERNNAMFLPLSSVSEPTASEWHPGLYALMPEGWWLQNKTRMVRMNDPVLEAIASQETPGFRAKLQAMQYPPPSFSPAPYSFFAEAFMTSYEKIVPNVARSANATRLALTACALERHRLAHGAYPDSLTALVPAYLPSVPLDIIDGAPLRYRLNPDATFTLYSLGLDGDDDNGHRAPTGSNDLTTDGDWAW
ncbi:hypothetical protein CMV30_16765 [Nibricoccus aquaticus]|uniref:Type II secretion system protein GspG C-terminal domain-containing protein n=1 Tax=Nibricoccus aquaticus TaxID=2576891 RepID=A0A290QMQ3_9BACT|nr:hypothetical protein [Nibricoccus aquaticus]ATC65462.1 hypothetical protein CMV30_16765 [Nibricoccus aquaticus]